MQEDSHGARQIVCAHVVIGQRVHAGVEIVCVEPFDGVRGLQVETVASVVGQHLIDGHLEQYMAERELGRRLGMLAVEKAAPLQFVDLRRQTVGAGRQRIQEGQGKGAAEHRCGLQRVAQGARQLIDTGCNQLVDAEGQRQIAGGSGARVTAPPGVALVADEPSFDQAEDDFFGEIRVALGAVEDPAPGGRGQFIDGEQGSYHLADLAWGQLAQVQLLVVLGAFAGGQQRQLAAALLRYRAVNADQQQRISGDCGQEIADQVERGVIGPMQVFEHEDERLRAAGGLQQGAQRCQRAVAQLGRGGVRQQSVPRAGKAHGKQPAEGRADLRTCLLVPARRRGELDQAVTDGRRHLFFAGVERPAKAVAQHIQKRCEAGRFGHFQAAPLQPQRPRRAASTRLGHQARFADTGLARDQQHLAGARLQICNGLGQQPQLGGAANKAGLQFGDAARLAQWQFRHGPVGFDGCRLAAQPHRYGLKRAGAVRVQIGHAIGQDLACCRGALQFRRLAQHGAEDVEGAVAPLGPGNQDGANLDAGRQVDAAVVRGGLQAKGHVQGTCSVVFVAARDAEQGHNAFRSQGIDMGGIALQDCRCAGQKLLHQLLLAAAPGARRPTDDAGIQHDDLAHRFRAARQGFAVSVAGLLPGGRRPRHVGDGWDRRCGSLRRGSQEGACGGVRLDAQLLGQPLDAVFVLAHGGRPVAGGEVQLDQRAMGLLFQRVKGQPAAGSLHGSLEVAGRGLGPQQGVNGAGPFLAQLLGGKVAPVVKGRGVAQGKLRQEIAAVKRHCFPESLCRGGCTPVCPDQGAELPDVDAEGRDARELDRFTAGVEPLVAQRMVQGVEGAAQPVACLRLAEFGPKERGQAIAAVGTVFDGKVGQQGNSLPAVQHDWLAVQDNRRRSQEADG